MKYLCDSDVNLKDMYSILYPNHTITHVPQKHFVFSNLRVLGEHFLSINSQRSPAIMACWGCPPPNSPTGIRFLKIGIVEYFIIHTAVFPNSTEKTPLPKLNGSRSIFDHFILINHFV